MFTTEIDTYEALTLWGIGREFPSSEFDYDLDLDLIVEDIFNTFESSDSAVAFEMSTNPDLPGQLPRTEVRGLERVTT